MKNLENIKKSEYQNKINIKYNKQKVILKNFKNEKLDINISITEKLRKKQ